MNKRIIFAHTNTEVSSLKNIYRNDKEMQQYFDTLPAFIQESIMQSGVDMKSKHDLKAFVDNLAQEDRFKL